MAEDGELCGQDADDIVRVGPPVACADCLTEDLGLMGVLAPRSPRSEAHVLVPTRLPVQPGQGESQCGREEGRAD